MLLSFSHHHCACASATEMFPEILHRALKTLEDEGNSDVASFYSHGRAFAVNDVDRFVSDIMPRFFNQTKWNRCVMCSGPEPENILGVRVVLF